MLFHFLADIIVLFHFIFMLFAVLGGMLSIWWRKIIWLHVPVALWAVLIEFTGGICPLTPLENWLRIRGRQPGYHGGFVEHYVLPVVYPANLTREIQVTLGAVVIAVNILTYWRVYMARNSRRFKRKRTC